MCSPINAADPYLNAMYKEAIKLKILFKANTVKPEDRCVAKITDIRYNQNILLIHMTATTKSSGLDAFISTIQININKFTLSMGDFQGEITNITCGTFMFFYVSSSKEYIKEIKQKILNKVSKQ